ncbi:MAG: exo-alpha-sialidase, partial [Christensenellaceae bacterium]|nr:exo-alpha-sialidase [Christensenellaceae bacterium]
GHRVLMTCHPQDKNIMSISFMRMLDGQLGMFFLRKTGDACVLNLVRSADEGETWDEPTVCTDDHYYVVNNDRVIRRKNGSLLFPANMHASPTTDISVQYYFGSDDDGRTWHKLTEKPLVHPSPTTTSGLQEGGVYEMASAPASMVFKIVSSVGPPVAMTGTSG